MEFPPVEYVNEWWLPVYMLVGIYFGWILRGVVEHKQQQ